MIRIVHIYLHKNYRLFNSSANINGHIRTRRYDRYVFYNELISELITIFSIDIETLKLWIYMWAAYQQSNIDLTEWWRHQGFYSNGNIGLNCINPTATLQVAY